MAQFGDGKRQPSPTADPHEGSARMDFDDAARKVSGRHSDSGGERGKAHDHSDRAPA
jgi:hypothetical protein